MNLPGSSIRTRDVSECDIDSELQASRQFPIRLVIRNSFIELRRCSTPTPIGCRTCVSDPGTCLTFTSLLSDSSRRPTRPSICLPYDMVVDPTAESEAPASNSALPSDSSRSSCSRCGNHNFDYLEDRRQSVDEAFGSFGNCRLQSYASSCFGVNDPQDWIKRSSTSSLSLPGRIVEGSEIAEATEPSPISSAPVEHDDRDRDDHFSARNPLDHAQKTTLLLKNLPKDWTRHDLFALLVEIGLSRTVDFLYIPTKLGANVSDNFRYGFANFTDHSAADNCFRLLHGFSDWPQEVLERCPLEISYSERMQGLSDHVERFRNSPVMHESVEDTFKPAVYADGVRIEFPRPTRHIKAPKWRRWKDE
eukprot:TRINITY_DN1734_c0_g3_i1.p1 TRINITY_DN1734_c0_g3~~TRINITY_DN1734_c0_g3_i1.p1  ORF type:complete len:363 (-),score=33.54 TRINITY_DN1734_c0_g3_i1:409-1497(-)